MARDAAKEFETENDSDQRPAAENVLARSLIAQGKYDQAAREIVLAQKLGARDLPTALSLSTTRATLLGKTAKTAEAERELQKVQSGAAGKGLLLLEWQARLALADVSPERTHVFSTVQPRPCKPASDPERLSPLCAQSRRCRSLFSALS